MKKAKSKLIFFSFQVVITIYIRHRQM